MKEWFAVYTKPRQEALATENLDRQGYETYLPRIRLDRRRRGRWRKVIEPLFPRYLFVHLASGRDNFAPIRSTFGAIDLVRFGGIPKVVPEELIDSIRDREDRDAGVHLDRARLQPGRRVEVVEGPFAGIRGLFESERAEERVIILLELLGRDNRVTVKRDAIVPA